MEDEELIWDDDWEFANTVLNCSSVTQVSPTQIFFALIVSFSNIIPNISENLLTIQEKRPEEGSAEPASSADRLAGLEATVASKSITLIFNSWIALARSEVSFG